MAAHDLTTVGARFHRLIVIGEPFKDKHYITYVKCRCDCGNESNVSCRQLVNGQTKSCGCLRVDANKQNAEKMVLSGKVKSIEAGVRIGKLVVLSDEAVGRGAGRKIKCRCDCGTECMVPISGLRQTRGTRSCGCLVAESQRTKHAIPVGERFGKLVVLGEVPRTGVNRKVSAQCDCGTIKDFVIHNLINGHTTSCGCQKLLAASKRSTHGHTRKNQFNRTYSVYRDMRTRCENPNYREFRLYGGRGIAVCERWRESYENFLADMGERPAGMTLERDRVNESYSPENCRWATPAEQAINKRNNVFIEYQGRRMTVSQWAAELGLDAKRLYYRVKQGWPPEKILAK
ncbi:hypothetical protein ACSC95_19115 [Burkholderia vietnamiensis]|uniref:hypothetical protein n=1 Tax=Burkholderia vietnamiensis TaxID=60552 RepID=UPI001B9C6F5B|nr:hypothetical protein [Burkholderia vietnamiensis]MBR8152793.1 hypothetical protein [Burkholderia vietnamiensis]HDR9048744.1 hypothetical protein [Burkholderia vietnamiensis]HDR9164549.1 hypothetical protein [Burkholderia vietnamiensis]HDR9235956.1 hypothetical protein [Burkholderia vietnamiensis]